MWNSSLICTELADDAFNFVVLGFYLVGFKEWRSFQSVSDFLQSAQVTVLKGKKRKKWRNQTSFQLLTTYWTKDEAADSKNNAG